MRDIAPRTNPNAGPIATELAIRQRKAGVPAPTSGSRRESLPGQRWRYFASAMTVAWLALGVLPGGTALLKAADTVVTVGARVEPFAKPVPGPEMKLPDAFNRISGLDLKDLEAIQDHVTNLVAEVAPAVVAVEIGRIVGSAVVISEDGLVLCAAHVCGQPDREVSFTFPDGRTAKGRTLGTNHEMDAGLMRITDPGPWPHVSVSSPSEARLGNWVLALGHPGGFDPGRPVVARLGRIIRVASGFLQTDCTLVSGDSGGPLFDMSGRVLAVHSRISSSTDANFHVPITTFLETWDRLARGESWGNARGYGAYVGVVGYPVRDGYRLTRVEPDSPAAKADLRVGDVVMAVDGRKVSDTKSYVESLSLMTPGEKSTFRIRRGIGVIPVQVMVERSGRFGRR